jgi:hypothetical protein
MYICFAYEYIENKKRNCECCSILSVIFVACGRDAIKNNYIFTLPIKIKNNKILGGIITSKFYRTRHYREGKLILS